jgi:hypothetical protein
MSRPSLERLRELAIEAKWKPEWMTEENLNAAWDRGVVIGEIVIADYKRQQREKPADAKPAA